MAVELNHLIVPVRDKLESAQFLADILDVPVGDQWGPFIPVVFSNGVSLDFMDATEFGVHHYAFLLSESEFDAALERIQHSGTFISADPFRQQPGEINHLYGGRGVYFDDPSGHQLEIITQPYGDAAEFTVPSGTPPG